MGVMHFVCVVRQHAMLYVAFLCLLSTETASSLKALRASVGQPFAQAQSSAPGAAPIAGFAPAAAPFLGPAPAPAPLPQTWDNIFPDIPGSGGPAGGQQVNLSFTVGPFAPEFSTPQCGVEAAGPICFGDDEVGVQMVLPAAVSAGVRGYWSFDQGSVSDLSGNKNHGYASVAPGPALGGQGSSAFFRRSFLEVLDSAGTLALEEFSYTFWVYLIEDGEGNGLQTCPIMRKGLGSSERYVGDDGRSYAAAPAILYDRFTRRLRIETLTQGAPGTNPGQPLLEAFESNAKLRSSRWVHIAVVRADKEKRTRLYVNGILDASHLTKGHIMFAQEPLYIGGDPYTREHCNLPMYIDEVRVYDRVLEADEIEAEAAPALQGVEPSFVRLACVDCPLEVAQRSCPSTYHICTSLDMHMGGYQVAHSMGYLQRGTHVWTHSAEIARHKKLKPEADPKATTDPGNVTGSGSEAAGGESVVAEVSGGPAEPENEPEPAPNAAINSGGVNGQYNMGGDAAKSDAWPGETVRATVVSLLQPEETPGAAAVAMANLPKLGLGLCCADD